MLSRERLDALYVCLPPDAHVDQELAAAQKGIHLFVEKPLPLDLRKAEAIARGRSGQRNGQRGRLPLAPLLAHARRSRSGWPASGSAWRSATS